MYGVHVELPVASDNPNPIRGKSISYAYRDACFCSRCTHRHQCRKMTVKSDAQNDGYKMHPEETGTPLDVLEPE